MARGNDERHNQNRRPQRPQTDEEKMAIVKQVFPNAKEVEPGTDVEGEREMQESLGALADKYRVYENQGEEDFHDDWRDLPNRYPYEDPDYRYDPNKPEEPEF